MPQTVNLDLKLLHVSAAPSAAYINYDFLLSPRKLSWSHMVTAIIRYEISIQKTGDTFCDGGLTSSFHGCNLPKWRHSCIPANLWFSWKSRPNRNHGSNRKKTKRSKFVAFFWTEVALTIGLDWNFRTTYTLLYCSYRGSLRPWVLSHVRYWIVCLSYVYFFKHVACWAFLCLNLKITV